MTRLALLALALAGCSTIREARPMPDADMVAARKTWSALGLPDPGNCPAVRAEVGETRFRELCQHCGPGRCASGECRACAAECVLYRRGDWVIVTHKEAPSGWAHGLAHGWQHCAGVEGYRTHQEPRVWCKGGFVERMGGVAARDCGADR